MNHILLHPVLCRAPSRIQQICRPLQVKYVSVKLLRTRVTRVVQITAWSATVLSRWPRLVWLHSLLITERTSFRVAGRLSLLQTVHKSVGLLQLYYFRFTELTLPAFKVYTIPIEIFMVHFLYAIGKQILKCSRRAPSKIANCETFQVITKRVQKGTLHWEQPRIQFTVSFKIQYRLFLKFFYMLS